MLYDEVRTIVDRAAELLPDPPAPGMAESYGRWEATVTGTGRRLAQLLDTDIELIRSLIADEQPGLAPRRQRRRLLLGVTMLAALELRLTQPARNPRPSRLDAA